MTDEQQLIPPLKEGDIVENQEVINEGKKNDGVVKYEGFIIFINDCKKGETVSFKITKILPKFAIGEKLEGGNNDN